MLHNSIMEMRKKNRSSTNKISVNLYNIHAKAIVDIIIQFGFRTLLKY